jgi:hypothetical protein
VVGTLPTQTPAIVCSTNCCSSKSPRLRNLSVRRWHVSRSTSVTRSMSERFRISTVNARSMTTQVQKRRGTRPTVSTTAVKPTFRKSSCLTLGRIPHPTFGLLKSMTKTSRFPHPVLLAAASVALTLGIGAALPRSSAGFRLDRARNAAVSN